MRITIFIGIILARKVEDVYQKGNKSKRIWKGKCAWNGETTCYKSCFVFFISHLWIKLNASQNLQKVSFLWNLTGCDHNSSGQENAQK